MSLPAKAILAWLLLFALMFANGAIRVLLLQPRFGEELARQVASLIGVTLVLLVSCLFARASPLAQPTQLLRVGAYWVGATVALEVWIDRYVSGLSWQAVLADYNLLRGRLWPLVLVSVGLGPWLCGTVGRAWRRWP